MRSLVIQSNSPTRNNIVQSSIMRSVACVPVLGEYVLELSPFGRSMRVNRFTTPDVLHVNIIMGVVRYVSESSENCRTFKFTE